MIIFLTVLHVLEVLSIIWLFVAIRLIGKGLIKIGEELQKAAKEMAKL